MEVRLSMNEKTSVRRTIFTSMTEEEYRWLLAMAEAERRTISNMLRLLVVEAAETRGFAEQTAAQEASCRQSA